MKDRLGASPQPRVGPAARHQRPCRRCAGPVGAISSTESPAFIGGRIAGRTPSRESPAFGAALGGARLDPSNRLTLREALVSRRTDFGGAGLNPSGQVRHGRSFGGAGLNPKRPAPGSETEPPGFLAGIPGKPDTESIVTPPPGKMEGLRRPCAQSVHF